MASKQESWFSTEKEEVKTKSPLLMFFFMFFAECVFFFIIVIIKVVRHFCSFMTILIFSCFSQHFLFFFFLSFFLSFFLQLFNYIISNT